MRHEYDSVEIWHGHTSRVKYDMFSYTIVLRRSPEYSRTYDVVRSYIYIRGLQLDDLLHSAYNNTKLRSTYMHHDRTSKGLLEDLYMHDHIPIYTIVRSYK